jgi:hypothetical protein
MSHIIHAKFCLLSAKKGGFNGPEILKKKLSLFLSGFCDPLCHLVIDRHNVPFFEAVHILVQ